MASARNVSTPLSFEIKSTQLQLVALQLKTTDLSRLSRDFAMRFGEMPDFFDDDGIVIDLSCLPQDAKGDKTCGLDTPLGFLELCSTLRDYRLRPMAIRGGSAEQIAAATAAGLLHTPDVLPQRAPVQAQSRSPAQSPEPVSRPPSMPYQTPAGAMVIDKPLRCGQQVYARGRDLVVMAMVNAGAEVIADGHIHVYAPLRGRAIAGARGNTDARVFALTMSSEMIGIAGVYDTGDHPVCRSVFGKAAQVSLASGPGGDRLVVEMIHA